jgi:ribose/xylose/arabinose/galactoside ABC-type transport system permease subunit
VSPRQLFDRAGVVLGLALVAAVFGMLLGPQFFSPVNLELILRQTAIVSTAALGMTIVIAAGGIDLSVGSMIALNTVVIALMLGSGASPATAAIGGVAATAVCGLVNGLLVTRLGVVPFIVTLGTMLVIRGAAKGLAGEVRLEAPITWLNDLLRRPDTAILLPAGVWLLAAISVVVSLLLRYTTFGRHVFAIGSNERMARLCGVPINRQKTLIYTLAGALTGIAGVLQFSRLSVGDPTVAVGLELNVIAAVVIGGGSLLGGRGSVSGSLIGSTIMTVIQIGCSQLGLANWVQEIVTGGIIITAVTLDRVRMGKT